MYVDKWLDYKNIDELIILSALHEYGTTDELLHRGKIENHICIKKWRI